MDRPRPRTWHHRSPARQTSAVTAPAPAAPTSATSHAAARRLTLLVGVGVLLVALLAGVSWWAMASARRDAVEVLWDDRDGRGAPVTCRGTTVPERALGEGLGRAPVLRLRPGMDCTLTFLVRNGGSSAVHLDAIVLPYLGPEGGAQVQVTGLDGLWFARRHSDGGLDAAYRVDSELGPGQTRRFTAHFAFREEGCSAGTPWIEDFPRVRVEALGTAEQVGAARTIAFSGAGTGPGCSL